ncbi:fascin domain-containing protein [Argonema antarcticum]|uniref:fascin domain-containing protein n=1 Tax=Argonema antarcticum TaxID=2942763 RepID=UPI002010F822|nr:RICIN domain-containing protein [Argonema antarcticum]MCL1472520.1 hypothetical protein [Argonema antarcticum A004/B2]
MQKYFSKAQRISKFTRLSSILITISTLSSSNIAYADINGIPFNPDFPKAEYPYAQAPDACSGVTNRPDSNGEIRDTWGPVDFRGACNTHDKCYYTVGSNWNICNERLYSDLRAACERDLKVSFNVPAPTLSNPLRTRRVDGPPDPARLAACYTIASGYYAGVQGGVALGVFNKAQDKQRRYESWVASIKNPTSPISTRRVFIRSAHGNYFLDHQIASRTITLADQPYNPTTGAYNGELWEIVDAGGGRVFIKSAHGNFFLDHQIASKTITLADQPYNPTTGAYNGELWEIVDAGGGRVFIKSAHGNFFLDHQIASRTISLADQPYNPTTGAYNGELWQIVAR